MMSISSLLMLFFMASVSVLIVIVTIPSHVLTLTSVQTSKEYQQRLLNEATVRSDTHSIFHEMKRLKAEERASSMMDRQLQDLVSVTSTEFTTEDQTIGLLQEYYNKSIPYQRWHILFSREEIAFSTLTYRPLNMSDYDFAFSLPYIEPFSLQFLLLEAVNLMNRSQLYSECDNAHYHGFTPCHGRNFSNVLLWKSLDYGNESSMDGIINDYDINAVSHIIAVRNVLINRDGRVFDVHHHYQRGGCADFGWHSWWFNYTYPDIKTIFYDEPVIVLTQPYFDQFFHEVIEVYSILITLKPVIDLYPNIKILVRSRFGRNKMFPILRLFGIEPLSLNIDVLDDQFTLVSARYAIVTLMGNCGHFMKNIGKAIQSKLPKLPSHALTPTNLILWYDRKYDQTRRISTGDDVMQELIDAYGSKFMIKRFVGNESFDETVHLFSSSKFVFGVHGAGMTNMLFMHPNTTVVEVRPENFNINLLEVMGGVLGLKYHVFRCGKGRYSGPVPLKPYQFIPYVEPFIKNDIG